MILLTYSPCAECGNLIPSAQTAIFWLAVVAAGIAYLLGAGGWWLFKWIRRKGMSHYQDFVEYVVDGDKDDELARTKAELAYALHTLEREIAIGEQARTDLASAHEALKDADRTFATLNFLETAWIRIVIRAALGAADVKERDDG